ncbi:uncharacterized protein LOC125950087 [Anopheles darlingi]|uniref:uncharacterized protein LOC125950087 n=1 Tax=Anopheles darlingi TaxID=43151 RepID=UPI0021005F13|nr:uncharacterized protein LOC125950087 [Anopheles darlingi]XP_049533672.1 uncharacterized protein LOC125950087 [Anopheles darlingi]XP_049533673.1 uncharacterized protein LOC125950087 [Anopheles darlingi]XP_049533674.1 uncharacterized protein LOC125950087 [Anopheles darlingi]XP_049533675.1 uncharacterized protein LOC125950087 [Anopheles darlingi]XP_049533676.1 uncharacterized protein LOC125950087 [Anopheles darlingi]XP_049533677.1 uncharacterized protein LOC125950087 [Anopheles darlingi]XP_0
MKSSMRITKIAAVRFMLVLHLFLNVKMCVVGGIGVGGATAGMPSSDSDINYDDGDSGEWQSSSSSSSSSTVEGGGRSKELPPSSPWSLGGVPVPSNLIRWNDPPSADSARPQQHGHVRSRMHHVRHEQHYLQGHHRASKPNKWQSVSEVDAFRGDGPPVIRDENHQKGRHGHHNHHNKHHNHHRTAGTSSESSEEASVTRHDHRHRQQLTDFGVTKDVSHGLSVERGASLGPRKHFQQVANRKRSTSSFHSEPPSMNALEHTFSSKQERAPQTTKNATSKSQYTLRSANPESKSYFEYLLNNYKSHSPLYKEHNAQQQQQQQQQQKLQTVQPQTRSLTKAKQQRSSGSGSSSSSSSSKATSSKSSKGKQSDNEYDYSYEDEEDEEVQNDGAYGEVAQTTTSRPTMTTTTVATTTTTTTETSQESSSGEGDQGSGGGGDKRYSMYIQSLSRMKNTQHRNGNNKYSSTSKSYHSRQTAPANNPVDPAKQVIVPQPYNSITDFKQANFGTKEAVERSYQLHQNNFRSNHNDEVQEHMRRIMRQGACKIPKPKVIPIPSNGSFYFLPERTILHRCDDETACCDPPRRCEAKHTEMVTLYFYMSTIEKKGRQRVNGQMKPHVIYMTNHTECHCVLPRPTATTTELPQVSDRSSNSSESYGACRCPEYFQSVIDPRYVCYCACLNNNRNCAKITEGTESISLDDRKCIKSGICSKPFCKYGNYDRVHGKCPAKREKIDQLIPSNRRNHHR